RRDEVVVRVAALVVEERSLAGGVLDVSLGDGASRGGLRCNFEDRQRAARVAAGARGDQRADLGRELDAECLLAAAGHGLELLAVQRQQLVELDAGQEGRVDLEVRGLGRRADQRDQALLDHGQECVLLRLVEPVDLVEEQDRTLPLGAQALAGARDHRADVVDGRRHGRELLERGTRRRGDDPRQRRLPGPRRAEEDRGAHPVLGDLHAQRRALREHVLLADELVERARAQPKRERRALRQAPCRRVREQVAHASKYAQRVSRQEQTGLADEFAPVLPGPGASDYERYLRTDELLSLQKTPEERAHHDELLFQCTHQASELWLKLAGEEMEVASAHLHRGEIAPALRLLGRSVLCFKLVTHALEMLELMSPWEDTAQVRPVLGHGSGFDSPGWNRVRHAAPALGEAFHKLRRVDGLSLADVYTQARERGELYRLAEALTDLDEWATTWRVRHYMVVERIIGGEVVGTQGTPVELLGKLIERKLYPELWKVRTELTNRAIEG